MRDGVRTDDTLGGDPRLDGTRIGVIHVEERLDAVERRRERYVESIRRPSQDTETA